MTISPTTVSDKPQISGKALAKTTPKAWAGKFIHCKIDPLHKIISMVACGILAALGACLIATGHPLLGVGLALASLGSLGYFTAYFRLRQKAIDKFVVEFLPHYYGKKENFADVPSIGWELNAMNKKLSIDFNTKDNLAQGRDKDQKLHFFASVNRKEKTINVYSFDRSCKECVIAVDHEKITLKPSLKTFPLFSKQ